MFPSPASDRNMKTFLTGIILGLGLVNSLILDEHESDDLQEFMKDEFLIPSLATQLPKTNTTIQSTSASSDHKDSDVIEHNPAGDNNNQSPSFEKVSELLPDHVNSILASELGSGEDEMQDQYSAISRAGAEVNTTLSASTAPPASTTGDKSDSELGTSEKLTESTPAIEELLQKSSSEHVNSILNSELGSGEEEMQDQSPAVSSTRADVSTTLSASTAPPTLTTGEESDSELKTSEKIPDSTLVDRELLQKSSSEHVYGILNSELGSGEEEMQDQSPAVSSTRAEVSTTLSASTAPPALTAGKESDSKLGTSEKSSQSTPVNEDMLQQTYLGNVQHLPPPASPNTGDKTPSWIIVLAFLVGVALLVIVGVAIATREKWIGPNQVYRLESQTNSSNQQRELEMKTFLDKDKPRENGKAAEYTIIPLDELPQSSTSH